MDNTLNTEQELGQHDETQQDVPPGQSPEPLEAPKPEQEADPIQKLQDELAEAKEKYIRLFADFENYRRRSAKERLEMILGANEQLLRTLLPVIDDFERAEKSFRDKSEKESEGFFLIQTKFKKILEQYGVKAMEIAKGGDFNADLHEAITHLPSGEENLKGKIIEVVESGYLLNDKVIRFAKVVVGS